MKYLQVTRNDIARMSANNTQPIKWYIDSSFAVHKDMRSHTRAIITFGKGAIILDSTKQQINARSSTKSKLAATDNTILKVLWTKQFIEAQGHTVKANIIY
jgi:hypothetical protein